jgi:ABC-type glycerol-3-phosphate transport system substrate-binding protein
MKNLKSLVLALFAGVGLMGCSGSADPTASSAVSLTMTASTANGLKTMNGRLAPDGRVSATTVTLTGVTVNLREIEFEYDGEDEHFKKDSSFR